MKQKSADDAYSDRNEAVRIETFEKLDPKMAAPLAAFFRRIGFPHVYGELVVPSLERGNTLVCAAVSDRPWPPWGVGAHTVHALAHVHPLSDTGASLSGVFALDGDLSNVGLQAAVYKETLEQLVRRKIEDVSYIVLEGSALAARVLVASGFQKTDDLFLTEEARYNVYRSKVRDHLDKLGLSRVAGPDLLDHQFEDAIFDRIALLLGATHLGTRPYWGERRGIPEILPNTGGGLDAAQPGGVGPSPS